MEQIVSTMFYDLSTATKKKKKRCQKEDFASNRTFQDNSCNACKHFSRQNFIFVQLWHFCMEWLVSFFFIMCVLAVKYFSRFYCGHGLSPFSLLLLAQPELGPPAQDSRAPRQASSPWSKPAAFLCCLLRESRKENLEHDPPKGFYSRFTRHSSLELPPLCPTLYLTLTICRVSAKNPIRLIWNSPGERTLSFWRTDN